MSILTLVVTLLALPLPPTETVAVDRHKSVEKYLSAWDTTVEPAWSIPACLAGDSPSIVGVWSSPGGFDYTSISVVRSSENSYRVTISTGGCMGGWRLDREARFEGGVLQLNKPIAEYYPNKPFSRLYAIRSQGTTLLVPSYLVETMQGAHKQSDCSVSLPRGTRLLTREPALAETQQE